MNKPIVACLFLSVLALGWCAGCNETMRTSDIDPKADEALRAMSDHLAGAQRFSFRAHTIMDELLEDGPLIEVTSDHQISLSRPDKAAGTSEGINQNHAFRCTSGRFTVFDQDRKLYATGQGPRRVDDLLDFLVDEYDLHLPLSDLLLSNPYKVLTESIEMGEYVGLHRVGSHQCHHLAFQQELIDWQIWVDAGELPLPRKLVITYKTFAGYPQYSATFDEWNMSPKLPDGAFEFLPPTDARQVELDELVALNQGD